MQKRVFASIKIGDGSKDLKPLFDEIIRTIPPPSGDPGASLQVLITNLDYSDFVGRLAVGRIFNGKLESGSTVGAARENGVIQTRVGVVYSHDGLKRVDHGI
ncbi:MAG: hypothetical protein ACUVQ2_01125 [Dissulfurimicrobium sp.]|uniref:hypothetical protein n=1 Tax=Dissulfurimicrobium sp. TaxID=2022436 RepID=UPI00404A5374